mmetsp:Transcript_28187/g.59314  ORF Transcript_28187/g.59314 Transcript_28187/m.59314 type:complete len:225 (+) Transcript_28187:2434-3108(+)
MISVYNRRKGENTVLSVDNDWIQRGILDDRYERFQVLCRNFRLIIRHEIISFKGTFVAGSERDKVNVSRWSGIVDKGTFHGIQVMRSNGHKGSLTTQVAMKLVLQVNEGFVAFLCESNILQNSGHYERTNCSGVRLLDSQGRSRCFGVYNRVHGSFLISQKDAQSSAQSLDAKQIITISGDINLVNNSIREGCKLFFAHFVNAGFLCLFSFRCNLVELDSKLEA